jgi:hypothetical protein
MREKALRVVMGPCLSGGVLLRVVELVPGGPWEAQQWHGQEWVPSPADLMELMQAPPASEKTLAEFGVPKGEA